MKKGQLTLIFILIIFLSYFFIKKSYTKKLNEFNEFNKILIERIAIHSDFCGFYNLDNSTTIRDVEGVEHSLKDVFHEWTIVLNVDKFNCQLCIEKAINEFDDKSKKNYNFSFVILVKNYNQRELILLFERLKKVMPVFLITDTPKQLNKLNDAGFPYLFLVNSDLEVSNIFFPHSQIVDVLNERYFSNLQRIINLDREGYSDKENIIEIKNPLIDLGNININKKYIITFEVLNYGTKPCIIDSISSSCGCAIPSMDLNPLLPDSVRKIMVEFKTSSKGEFYKTISLKVNSKKNPYRRMSFKGIAE